MGPPGVSPTPPRIVSVPQGREPVPALQRPPLGQSKIERSTIGRAQMPPPPRLGAQKRSERAPEGPPPAVRQAPPKPEPHVEKPAPSQQRPPLGQSKIERGATGRAQPPPSAGLGGQKPPERASEGPPPAIRQAPPQPKPPAEMNQPRVVRPKTPTPLPGEPANRLAPNRAQARPQAPVEQQTPRMEKKAPAVAPKPQPVRPHGSPGIEPKEGPESRK